MNKKEIKITEKQIKAIEELTGYKYLKEMSRQLDVIGDLFVKKRTKQLNNYFCITSTGVKLSYGSIPFSWLAPLAKILESDE